MQHLFISFSHRQLYDLLLQCISIGQSQRFPNTRTLIRMMRTSTIQTVGEVSCEYLLRMEFGRTIQISFSFVGILRVRLFLG